MRDWQGKRYWIIGASEGVGAAVARKLCGYGVDVVLSARSTDRLRALADGLPRPTRVVGIDVQDQASVDAAVEEVGEVDGVVFLAGACWPVTARDWDAGKVAAMVDVTFTGLTRVLGRVVPAFVARDRGHIVVAGSLAAFRGRSGAIGAGASRAATLSLAESMRADLRGTGVEVQIANPGPVRPPDAGGARRPFVMAPEAAAEQIVELMGSNAFSRSFPWLPSVAVRLGRLLSG